MPNVWVVLGVGRDREGVVVCRVDNFNAASEQPGRAAAHAAEMVSATEVAAAHDNTSTRVYWVLPYPACRQWLVIVFSCPGNRHSAELTPNGFRLPLW